MKKTILLIASFGVGLLTLDSHAMNPDDQTSPMFSAAPAKIPQRESHADSVAWHKQNETDGWIDREHHESIPSTQLLARERAKEISNGRRMLAINKWGLVTANEQTGGIGQHNRTWISPAGYNIYATYIIPWPSEHEPKLVNVAQTITLAVAECIEAHGIQTKIKWVNDLLVVKSGEEKGEKLSGVLSENTGSIPDAQHSLCLVGIGINVNIPQRCFEGVDQPVTSLFIETGKEFDREQILYTLSGKLRSHLRHLINCGFDNMLLPEVTARLAYKDRKVYIEDEDTDGNNIVRTYGTLRGIDKFGGAILETETGGRTFYNGRLFPTIE